MVANATGGENIKAPAYEKSASAGRPVAALRQKKLDDILKSAERLFIKRGYSGTSLLEIARDSKVSSATIYSNVGDKRELFSSVVWSLLRKTEFAQPSIDPSGDLRANLAIAASNLLAGMSRPSVSAFLQLLVCGQSALPNLVRPLGDRFWSDLRDPYREFFAGLARAGLMPAHSVDEAAEHFLNLVLSQNLLRSCLVGKVAHPDPAVLSSRMELFVRWIKHVDDAGARDATSMEVSLAR